MYNKLFAKIVDSSIWLEPLPVFRIFTMFIALMDEDGFCQFASPANVAHRAIVPLDAALEALRTLEAPDPSSGDPDNDGRRIERTAGGWIVLNAKKYRDIVTREESKRLQRDRSKRYRANKRDALPNATSDDNVSVTQRDTSVTQRDDTGVNRISTDSDQGETSRGVTARHAASRETNGTVTQSEADTDTEAESERHTPAHASDRDQASTAPAAKPVHPRSRFAPSIVASAKTHAAHVFCSALLPCVPNFLHHDDLRKRIGGDPETAHSRLLAWYAQTEAAHTAGAPIAEDGPKWWRRQFEAWIKGASALPAPMGTLPRVGDAELETLLDRIGLSTYLRVCWFKHTEMAGDTIIAPDGNQAEWIARNYLEALSVAAGRTLRVITREAVSA